MSLPSIFKQKTDQRSFDTTANFPGASTGFLVSTADIIAQDIDKNPYFRAVQGVSQTEIEQFNDAGITKYNALKSGYSIVHKPPGTIRDVKAYINPKSIDLLSGGANGKLTAINTTRGGEHSGEMINIGGRTIIPIVVGVTSQGKLNPYTGSGENTPAEAAAAFNGVVPSNTPYSGPPVGTGVTVNYHGKNAATGTTKTSLRSLLREVATDVMFDGAIGKAIRALEGAGKQIVEGAEEVFKSFPRISF